MGRIWLQFIRAYYIFDRVITKVENGEPHGRMFQGTRYGQMAFDLSVDVGASSEYSEVLSQSTLDSFLANGFITVDQYIELAPVNVVPFKERLKQMREEQREQETVKPRKKTYALRPSGTRSVHGIDGVELPEIPTVS